MAYRTLNLPGPRAPLSGPCAALAAMLFSGGPMVVWSLVVDKVHRRPSTGIDWTLHRPAASIGDTKLAGLWATFALIGALYCVARWYWRGSCLFSMEVIGAAAITLFVLSVPYVLWLDRYLVNPRDGEPLYLARSLRTRRALAATVPCGQRRNARPAPRAFPIFS